jgi:hypothetical protein
VAGPPEAVRHERELDFAERDKCKPVLLRLSLAGNLEKPLMSLYGTKWRERGHGLGKKGLYCSILMMGFSKKD